MKGATEVLSSGITQCAITANLSGVQDAREPKITKIKAYFFPENFIYDCSADC